MRKLTIPFLGASGNSVHLAGMHFGTRLHVPLWQTELAFELGWQNTVQNRRNYNVIVPGTAVCSAR